ncbi:MAG TPA: c-type cytochrome [Patescibacteria group bacterium]|nr:c-type cytochrome [Patescibacteria group bacterium]
MAAASVLSAAAPTDVLTKNACLACHGVANKIVGPGYNEVAAKYKDVKDAKAQLRKSIKEGGSGKWGQIPMAPQPNLAEADLNLIVDWLLDGAKA